MGATGPSGPPGAGYFVDGGVVRADFIAFAGFTAAQFTGDLGGNTGANQKCNAEYPGSYFCTETDYARSEAVSAPSALGAWVDFERSSNGVRNGSACYQSPTGGWTHAGTGDTALVLDLFGRTSSQYCNGTRPLACCQSN